MNISLLLMVFPTLPVFLGNNIQHHPVICRHCVTNCEDVFAIRTVV